MSDSNPPVKTPALLVKYWAPTWLTDPPPFGRTYSIAIVATLVLLIGWLDYIASIWFSLQIFYLLPVILSVAWLGWKEGCATVVLCVAVRMTGDYADDILSHINWVAVLWNRFIDLSVSCILVWVVHTLISLQRELEQRVEQRTAALEQAIHARNRLQSELLDVSARGSGTPSVTSSTTTSASTSSARRWPPKYSPSACAIRTAPAPAKPRPSSTGSRKVPIKPASSPEVSSSPRSSRPSSAKNSVNSPSRAAPRAFPVAFARKATCS